MKRRFPRAPPRARVLRFRASGVFFVGAFCATSAPGHAWPYEPETTRPPDRGVAFTPAISAASWHTCAVGADGGVRCWGGKDGSRQDRTAPVPVRGLSDVAHIAAGTWTTCAVRVDGAAFCWGNGVLGALGDGRNHTSDLPVPVTGITDAIEIAVGESHACALQASGRVSCWGRNTWGQLGDGEKNDSNTPRAVIVRAANGRARALEDGVGVATGYAHTCVAHVDGTVSCWGANWFGQLGTGGRAGATSPVRVARLSRVKAIAAGNLDSCALLSDGTARCWGSNAAGQIGDGSLDDALEPVAPSVARGEEAAPPAGLVAIRTGDHSCAVDVTGAMVCWGANYDGQLGDGTRQPRRRGVVVLPL